jgi:hypothetical protein
VKGQLFVTQLPLLLEQRTAQHCLGRQTVVGEHLAGAGDVAHHTVEDAPPVPVVIHSQLEEMAQKTPALRDAKGERVANAGTIRSCSAADINRRGTFSL